MTIELYPPLALHEQGQREGNEDSIYPPLEDHQAQATSNVFLVCDGVGGAEKGEEASQLACKTFAEFLRPLENVKPTDVEKALLLTEDRMNDFIRRHPDAEGMATTLTLVTFNRQGALIAHIGDSRVYQVRQGKILFKTSDHSFVSELLANHLITEEQAATHPKRNVVTRAIMGSQRPTKADLNHISDVRIGDYFFLCSDGILESVSDARLTEILGENNVSDKSKLSQILTLCQHKSRDNFSAYLLRIKSVIKDGPVQGAVPEPTATSVPKTKKSRMSIFFTGAALAAVTMVILVVLMQRKQAEAPAEVPVETADTTTWWIPDTANSLIINPDSIVNQQDSTPNPFKGSATDSPKSETAPAKNSQ